MNYRFLRFTGLDGVCFIRQDQIVAVITHTCCNTIDKCKIRYSVGMEQRELAVKETAEQVMEIINKH